MQFANIDYHLFSFYLVCLKYLRMEYSPDHMFSIVQAIRMAISINVNSGDGINVPHLKNIFHLMAHNDLFSRR